MTYTTTFDATNILEPNIPLDAPAFAYYIPNVGRYGWNLTQINRRPTTKRVSITPFAQFDAMVLDVETGDASPQDCPGWLDRNSNNRGIYCNRNTLQDVLYYVGRRPRKLWVAVPGPAIMYPGANATQFGFPGIYDVSIFDNSWWNLIPPAVHPPIQQEDDPMPFIAADKTGTYLVSNDLKTKLPLQSVQDVALFEKIAVALDSNVVGDTLTLIPNGI